MSPVVAGAQTSQVVGPLSLMDEEWREYEFPSGRVYRIWGPVALYYRSGGSTHRVEDKFGVIHCIAAPTAESGMVLRWQPKAGAEKVSF